MPQFCKNERKTIKIKSDSIKHTILIRVLTLIKMVCFILHLKIIHILAFFKKFGRLFHPVAPLYETYIFKSFLASAREWKEYI